MTEWIAKILELWQKLPTKHFLIISLICVILLFFLFPLFTYAEFVSVDIIIDGNHFLTSTGDAIEIPDLKISDPETAKAFAEFFLKGNSVWLIGNNYSSYGSRIAKIRLKGNQIYSDLINLYGYDKEKKCIYDIKTKQPIAQNPYTNIKETTSNSTKQKPLLIDATTSKSIRTTYEAIKNFNKKTADANMPPKSIQKPLPSIPQLTENHQNNNSGDCTIVGVIIFIIVLLPVFSILRVLFLKPNACQICGNPIKKTSYIKIIDGKKYLLCPSCNSQIEKKNSRDALKEKGFLD